MKHKPQKAGMLLLFWLLLQVTAHAQAPFWKDIQAFKQSDSLNMPPPNAILFVGSSSFTKWTDVQSYFPGYTIVNRGFGGSTLPDVIRYANDIIFPYHPKQVVIYCGDNDFASSDTITAATVTERFVTLFNLIRSRQKDVDIAYVSIKPSPSRKQLWPKMKEANDRIRDFLEQQVHAAFIDVYHEMLQENGDPRSELFVNDQLHMNKEGYVIWQKAIQPYLIK
jgi:lysophospholipase L1-like esterase